MTAPLAAGERVALTGATGMAGSYVLAELRQCGHPVRALARHPPRTPAGIDWQAGDLDQRDFTPFLEGARALVHAGFAHLPGRYRGGEGNDPQSFWQTNFLGTQRLLAQARSVGVRRVVLFSSRAVYRAGVWPAGAIDESLPAVPDTHYGAMKAAIETLARLESSAEMAVICLRPTGLYGLRPTLADTKWAALVRSVLDGRPITRLGTTTEVHAGDLAGIVKLVLEAPVDAVAAQLFNVSDVLVDGTGLVARIAEVAAKPVPPIRRQSPLSGPILSSRKIQRLGYRFGGPDALDRELRSLIEACRMACR